MKRTLSILLVAAAILVAAVPANGAGYRGWGPRVGLSSGPDAVHFGAHFDYGNLADHIRIQPNPELRIGEDGKLLALNAEAAYRLQPRRDVWSPCLGAGIGANIKSQGGWRQQRPPDRPAALQQSRAVCARRCGRFHPRGRWAPSPCFG